MSINNAKTQVNKAISEDFVGSDEFRKSKIGYLTGVSAFAKSASSALRPAVGFGSAFGRIIYRFLKSNAPTNQHIRSVSDDAERFEAAMIHYGRTYEDLPGIQRQSRNAAMLYAALSIAATGWGCYLLSSDGYSVQGLLRYVFPFFLLSFLVPYYLKYSLYYHHVKHRRLTKFGEFLRSPRLIFAPITDLFSAK